MHSVFCSYQGQNSAIYDVFSPSELQKRGKWLKKNMLFLGQFSASETSQKEEGARGQYPPNLLPNPIFSVFFKIFKVKNKQFLAPKTRPGPHFSRVFTIFCARATFLDLTKNVLKKTWCERESGGRECIKARHADQELSAKRISCICEQRGLSPPPLCQLVHGMSLELNSMVCVTCLYTGCLFRWRLLEGPGWEDQIKSQKRT